MTIETERMAELHIRNTEIMTEMNGLDQYNKRHQSKILTLYKEHKKIQKEGKELLKQHNGDK